MLFTDITASVGGNRHSDIELFYWTPDMPQIPFEQAYKHYLYFKENPNALSLVNIASTDPKDTMRLEKLRKLAIDLIYTTWDHAKFQVNKPVYYFKGNRTRDKYYLTHTEFSSYLDVWDYHANAWSSAINTPYFNNRLLQSETVFSKWYKIGYFQ
jgi:hypothetical protein